jgi:cyclase
MFRKLFSRCVGFALLASLTLSALSHDGKKPQQNEIFRLQKLTDNAYALYGRGGNVGFIVTNDGVLVVDDQFNDIAPGIVEQIKKVTDQPIRYLINTHHHGDHTGGNPTFIKFALIIGHHNVRKHMLMQPAETLRDMPATIARLEKQLAETTDEQRSRQLQQQLTNGRAALEAARNLKVEDIPAPGLTYEKEIRIYLGGEEVQVFHHKRGHTDGDSIIYFPRSKTLHMGDLFFNKMHPFIDVAHGGSTKEWIETLDAVLARVPADAIVIPGHGPVTDTKQLRSFRDYFADHRAAVAEAIKQGKSKDEAVAAIKLDKYADYPPGFRTLADTIRTIYDEIKAGN